MLTRGKVHNNSDEASHEPGAEDDGMNDENCSEKGSSSSKDRQSEERSFRSNSGLKIKHTPKTNREDDTSPILVIIDNESFCTSL